MKTKEIVEKWKNGEEMPYMTNKHLYKVAKKVNADTSVADNLQSADVIGEALIEAINKRMEELKN